MQEFINNTYIPDVLAVAGAYADYCEIGAGCMNLLSYGAYDLDGTSPDYTTRQRLFSQGTVSADLKHNGLDITRINESVKHSWYEDDTTGRHPSKGDTKPLTGKWKRWNRAGEGDAGAGLRTPPRGRRGYRDAEAAVFLSENILYKCIPKRAPVSRQKKALEDFPARVMPDSYWPNGLNSNNRPFQPTFSPAPGILKI